MLQDGAGRQTAGRRALAQTLSRVRGDGRCRRRGAALSDSCGVRRGRNKAHVHQRTALAVGVMPPETVVRPRLRRRSRGPRSASRTDGLVGSTSASRRRAPLFRSVPMNVPSPEKHRRKCGSRPPMCGSDPRFPVCGAAPQRHRSMHRPLGAPSFSSPRKPRPPPHTVCGVRALRTSSMRERRRTKSPGRYGYGPQARPHSICCRHVPCRLPKASAAAISETLQVTTVSTNRGTNLISCPPDGGQVGRRIRGLRGRTREVRRRHRR